MFSAAKTAGPFGYKISRSVRLRSSASAYLNRTFTTSTDGKKFTISLWLKRGILGNSGQTILWGNNPWTFALNSVTGTQGSYPSDSLLLWNYGTNTAFASPTAQPLFRDPSAWYHIVMTVDTAQATAANRVLIYVNGTNYPTTVSIAQNTALSSAIGHVIGKIESAATYSDAYVTEYYFIDGQALTPSSFGSTNAVTGVWQPAKYTGTYGNNGFYLNFSDNSAATAAAIGKDYSGNGNNWTPNNISVTAGATYDSMIDVPTPYADGSTGRGNYAVINPLSTIAFPVTNGNLSIGASTTANRCSKSSIAVSSGKWYWEFKASAISASGQMAGVCSADALFNGGTVSSGYEVGYYSVNGNKYVNGTASAYGASWTTTDTIGVALDVDGGTVTFYKNNVSQGAISITAGQTWVADWTGQNVGDSVDFTFGQRPFTYTPPSGFKALNTYNLPASTITNGGKYMAATTFTGVTGGGSVDNTVNGISFKPDFVWMKTRSTANNHELADSVRGTAYALFSNLTNAEVSDTRVSAFNSNGFNYGTNSNSAVTGRTSVGWQWQAGQGSTSSNASGTITSTVSVNATAGFSVVTYTNQLSGSQTVGHGLGVAPAMIFVKLRSTTSNWFVYHKLIGNTGCVFLDTTSATNTSSTYWNNTSPTSSVFTIGTIWNSTATAVAYCWAEIAGFSKFGSYTGNGSTDGPFVYCGFRPRWVMIKRTDSAGFDWFIYDSARDTYNVTQNNLRPNTSGAESSQTANYIDLISNGFKLRGDNTGSTNNTSATFIFAAFAENPFANALAR